MKPLFQALLLVFFLVSIGSSGYAQIRTYQEQIDNALLENGVTESEFRAALEKIGLDFEQLDNLSPLQVRAVRATMLELKEKREVALLSGDITVDSSGPMDSLTLVDSLSLEPSDAIDSSRDARIYGQHIFFTNAITLIPEDQLFSPSEDYILDAGDELHISAFGSSVLDKNYVIEKDGGIRIQDQGITVLNISLAGSTLSEARSKIAKGLARRYNFSAGQLSVQVKSARIIRVQVLGEVVKPGDYSLSALNSAVNIIGAAGGLTDNGSVRNIQIIHTNGQVERVDLYALLDLQNRTETQWLRTGDIIVVPAAARVVNIKGAVNREHNYEIVESDGIKDLISYAGGLASDAYLKSIQLTRYDIDKKVLKDIPYADLLKEGRNFTLQHGDEIVVSQIKDVLENYVVIKGDVRREGEYELTPQMTLRELLDRGGLKQTSRTDFAYLKRTKNDGNITYIALSLDNAMNGVMPEMGLFLQNKDEIQVWSLDRFTDLKEIKIDGAVRYPDAFAYDEDGNLRVADLILSAGGLRRDAASFAHVHRLDPLNPNDRLYISVNLERAINDKNSADNFILEPFDSLYVYSKNDFLEEVFVHVEGAVNNPGSFAYGDQLTLKDAMIMAGGFKRSSATNNIEISRVIIEDNKPTKTVVEKIALDRNALYDPDDSINEILLEPHDQIFVRYVPEFELQSNVLIEGEIIYPGEFALIESNERVSDLVRRAGGLTDEAFSQAATFFRSQDSIGSIVIRLDEVLTDLTSKYNYVLIDGDRLIIPKRKETVSIAGATQFLTQNPEQKTINVPYFKGKSAKYYIDNFAGGFADNARRDKIFVVYPNGGVAATIKKFPFGKKHPEVLPGSEIQVGFEKEKKVGVETENVNWTKVFGDSVAQAMSILTLVLLVQRLD